MPLQRGERCTVVNTGTLGPVDGDGVMPLESAHIAPRVGGLFAVAVLATGCSSDGGVEAQDKAPTAQTGDALAEATDNAGATQAAQTIILTSTPPATPSKEPTTIALPDGTQIVVSPTAPTPAVTTEAQVPTKEVTASAEPSPTAASLTLEEWANTTEPTGSLQISMRAYATAMGINVDDIKLTPIIIESKSGSIAVLVDQTFGKPLFISEETTEGGFRWTQATVGEYWSKQGKVVGVYLNGEEGKNPTNAESITKNFGGGTLSLNGQVRPGPDIEERKPENAQRIVNLAKQTGAGINFHYIVEPGKYPVTVTAENIDAWLDTRLAETADVLSLNTGKTAFIEYNEAWSTRSASVNEERDPLKDKYPDTWAEEYIHRVISVFMAKGLMPNKDFVVTFNENRMFNNDEKQELVHNTLLTARQKAFERLRGNPEIAATLAKIGITSPEQIQIILGVETHTKLGQQVDDGTFIPEPTEDQIKALSLLFSDLGGIILTEVNPQGNAEQQAQFLDKLSKLLKTDPHLRGIILWNVFGDPSDGTDSSGLSSVVVPLFDAKGNVTKTYYSLLK